MQAVREEEKEKLEKDKRIALSDLRDNKQRLETFGNQETDEDQEESKDAAASGPKEEGSDEATSKPKSNWL